MTKAKELVNVVITLLVIGAVFSLYLGSHRQASVQAPAFVYDEVVVQKSMPASQIKEAAKAVPVPNPILPVESVPPIVPPRIISEVIPEYPAPALEKGIEGVVMVQAFVGLNGKPERVEVKAASGNAELDASAIKAVSQWTFSPAAQGGASLASWFEVPVRFSIK